MVTYLWKCFKFQIFQVVLSIILNFIKKYLLNLMFFFDDDDDDDNELPSP